MTLPTPDPQHSQAEPPAPQNDQATSSTAGAEDPLALFHPQASAEPPPGTGVVPEFQVRWRGYDRLQVDSFRRWVQAELASTRDAHHRAMYAHARTAEWLRAAQNDVRRLHGQLANSPTALSDRLQEILQLAAQDADETRSAARAEADQVRSRAQAEGQELLQDARETADGIVSEAVALQRRVAAELEQARTEAAEARERADAEAAAGRRQADEQARRQREQADAAATQRLADLARHRDEMLADLHRIQHALASAMEASNRGPASSASTPPAAGSGPANA